MPFNVLPQTDEGGEFHIKMLTQLWKGLGGILIFFLIIQFFFSNIEDIFVN